MIVTLNEAKKYLRVDYPDEDSLIKKFILTGETLTEDTLRKPLTDTKLNKVAVLYVVAYQNLYGRCNEGGISDGHDKNRKH